MRFREHRKTRRRDRWHGGDTRAARQTQSRLAAEMPIDFMSVADATPVTISATTSGITVMRIAFTHSVPMGTRASAAFTSDSFPDAAMRIPPPTAAARATTIRVLSFIALHHEVAAVDVEGGAVYVPPLRAATQIMSATSPSAEALNRIRFCKSSSIQATRVRG